MYNKQYECFGLKSRKRFLKCTKKLETDSQTVRLKLWEVESKQKCIDKLPQVKLGVGSGGH